LRKIAFFDQNRVTCAPKTTKSDQKPNESVFLNQNQVKQIVFGPKGPGTIFPSHRITAGSQGKMSKTGEKTRKNGPERCKMKRESRKRTKDAFLNSKTLHKSSLGQNKSKQKNFSL
jgi:hypothetical protein